MPLSPNMNLPIPVPSQTGGPQYALDEQSCFQQIDSHNHTPGQGSLVPLNALDVNQNLSMGGFSVTNLKSLQLNNQLISPGSSSLYMLGNDLYFADGTGAFNVQITSGNAVAVSGAVGFSGLPSGTASAAYLSLLGTFRFQSATNTAATLDVGPLKTRNTLAGSNAVTINAPNPLPADYSITLPSALPPSDRILRMSATGAISNNLDVDGSTLQIAANQIYVANNGITLTQMADNSVGTNELIDLSVTTNKIANGAVTASKLATGLTTSRDYSAIPNTTLNPLFGNNGGTLYSHGFTTSKANAIVQVCLKPITSSACFGNTYASAATAGYCWLQLDIDSNTVAYISGIEITTATKSGYTTRAALQAPIVMGSLVVAAAGAHVAGVNGGFSSSQGQHDLVLNGYALEIIEMP